MDEEPDKVLERLEDPLKPGPWDRRGMLVGDVHRCLIRYVPSPAANIGLLRHPEAETLFCITLD